MKIRSTTTRPVKPVSKTVFNKDKPREEPSPYARVASRIASEYMKGKDDGLVE